MADHDLLHTAEIMKAALPYIGSTNKVTAELFVKAFDLLASIKSMKSNKLSAFSLEISKIDVEGLLNGIRPICNIREREMVDRILNIFNMKRTFEMYNNMMETMKTMQEFGGFPFGDSSNENDTDNVTGNFSGSNFESIFQSVKNFMGSSGDMGASGDTEASAFSGDSEVSASSGVSGDSAFSGITGNSAFSGINGSYEAPPSGIFSHVAEEVHEEIKEADSPTEQIPPTKNSGNRSNDMMFEMLKTMVPPEQMSTFENLSMLLNSMSYDNNSKTDNKERNDG